MLNCDHQVELHSVSLHFLVLSRWLRPEAQSCGAIKGENQNNNEPEDAEQEVVMETTQDTIDALNLF